MLPMLNRTPVIVRPKEPFLAWATEVFRNEAEPPSRASVEAAFLAEQPSVYLIPLIEDRAILEETMGDFCQLIFESELETWCTDIAEWPKDRDDWDKFQRWFDWTALDGVFDTFEADLTLE